MSIINQTLGLPATSKAVTAGLNKAVYVEKALQPKTTKGRASHLHTVRRAVADTRTFILNAY